MFVATVERRHDLEPLDGLLLALSAQALLALGRVDLLAELALLLVEVERLDQAGDGVGAHAALEVVAPAVDKLAPQHLVFDDLATEQALELVPGPIEDLLLELELLTDLGEVLVGLPASRLQFGVLGVLLLETLEFLLELLVPASQVELHVLVDGLALTDDLGLERRQVLVATLLVDGDDQVGGEVDDLLELLGLELLARLGAHQQVGQPRTGAPQVPDVDRRGGQLDVAHPLTADLRAGDLHAAALTDDALEPDALVLATRALPVLGGTEDLLAEESVLLGLQGAVVDGLRLLDLAVGPHADAVRRCEPDLEVGEIVYVKHVRFPQTRAARAAARAASSSSDPRSGRWRSIPSSSTVRNVSSSSSRISIS